MPRFVLAKQRTQSGSRAIAFGIGTSQVRDVLATQTMALGQLKVRRIEVNGKLRPGVSLAAVNGPAACAVSGPTEAVAAFEEALRAEGVEVRRLHTSHAFHSAMMDPCVPAMRAALEGVVLSPPAIPIVSTVTSGKLRSTSSPATSVATARRRTSPGSSSRST